MTTAIVILVTVVVMVLTSQMSIFSVPQLVAAIPTDLSGHSIPVVVKLRCILLIHLSKNVVFFSVVPDSLLNYFAALPVEHAFVSHLLMTSCLVVVHLVALCDALAVGAMCTLSLRLINFADRLTVGPHLCNVAVGLHLEVTFA